jgi:hypothetical protein
MGGAFCEVGARRPGGTAGRAGQNSAPTPLLGGPGPIWFAGDGRQSADSSLQRVAECGRLVG